MTKRILLVEDDFAIQDMYKRVLEQAGYEVMVTANGKEGVELFNHAPFDLVLLDIMLPDLDGISALTQMKQNQQNTDTKIVMLTNLGQDDVIKKAFAIGANSYLIKSSLTPYQVVDEVKSIFDNQ